METKNITIRLKLFSIARDLAGIDETLVEVPPNSKPEAVFSYLISRNPVFERSRTSLRIAVNMEYIDSETPLRDGDEVAIIPPVSGG